MKNLYSCSLFLVDFAYFVLYSLIKKNDKFSGRAYVSQINKEVYFRTC
jgi:hypothetical protein